MFDKVVNKNTAIALLGLNGEERLESALTSSIVDRVPGGADNVPGYLMMDIIKLQLSESLRELDVDKEKAFVYAHTILSARSLNDETDLKDWLSEDGDDLYCLIEDKQLARVFLRSSLTGREVDIAAVKPVLLPTTKCELNVSRALRPMVKRAIQNVPTDAV